MKKEKFKVIQFTRELIIKLENELDNFPKKDIEIKNKIKMSSYELLALEYEANTTQNNTRKIELLEKCIAKIKVIDFLLDMSYERKLITQKKLIKLGLQMDDIIKYCTGWLKTIDENRV